jgi:hypothetical protein
MLDYYSFNNHSSSNHLSATTNGNFNKPNSVASAAAAVAMLSSTPYAHHYSQNFANQHVQSQFTPSNGPSQFPVGLHGLNQATNNNNNNEMAKPSIFQSAYPIDATGQNNFYTTQACHLSPSPEAPNTSITSYYLKTNSTTPPNAAFGDLIMNRQGLGFSGFSPFGNAAAANCYLNAVAAAAVATPPQHQQPKQTNSLLSAVASSTAKSLSSSPSLPLHQHQYQNMLSVSTPTALSTSTASSNSSPSSSASPQSTLNGKSVLPE